jgi:hypothetical protein
VVAARAAHDERARRDEPLRVQVEQRGQQLLLRQVARRVGPSQILFAVSRCHTMPLYNSNKWVKGCRERAWQMLLATT